MPTLYRYTPHVETGPQGRTVRHEPGETAGGGPALVTLCELGGQTYVSLPDGETLPPQPPEITLDEVAPTADLHAEIKAAARPVRSSKQAVRRQIRAIAGDPEDQIADLEKRLAMTERLLYLMAEHLLQGQAIPPEISTEYLGFVQNYAAGVASGEIKARSDAEFVDAMFGYLTARSTAVTAAAEAHVAEIERLLPPAS